MKEFLTGLIDIPVVRPKINRRGKDASGVYDSKGQSMWSQSTALSIPGEQGHLLRVSWLLMPESFLDSQLPVDSSPYCLSSENFLSLRSLPALIFP